MGVRRIHKYSDYLGYSLFRDITKTNSLETVADYSYV